MPFFDDRASLLVHAADFYQPLADDDTLLQIVASGFIPHTSNTINGAGDPIDIKTEDEVVAYKRIKIDLGGSDFNVSVKKILTGVRIKNSITNKYTDLDAIAVDFTGTPILNGLENIKSIIPRSFKMPTTELAKNFRFYRDTTADSGTNRYYNLLFPFLVRWEYWEAITTLNEDFYDESQENNGLNNNWAPKDEVANWDFYHFMELTFSINGREHTIIKEDVFKVDDYDSNPDWDNKNCKSYDENNNELTNPPNGFLQRTAKTKIVAQAEYVGAGSPLLSDIRMLFRLEPKENGGRFISTRISSERDSGNESQWYIVGSEQIVITSPSSNVFVGTAYIDNNKLQNFNIFAITVRIYDGLTGSEENANDFSPADFNSFDFST